MLKKSTVAIGIHVWNGEKTITETLKHLVNQSYKEIKIFILDNQSNDGTVGIVKSFQKYNKNIFLIIDKKKRDPAAAQRILVNKYLKDYEFCVMIGDDDVLNKSFIENLLLKLIKEKTQLCYSSYKLINLKKKLMYIKNYPIYDYKNINNFFFNTYSLNLTKFIIYRNLVPLIFGIFKTQALIKSFKHYKIYDKSLLNFDNLMLVDFFANNKVSYVNKNLFYYRKKDRKKTGLLRNQKGAYQLQNSLLYQFLIFKYQFTLSIKMIILIKKSVKLKLVHKLLLYILIIIIYPQKCFSFIIKNTFFIKSKYNE